MDDLKGSYGHFMRVYEQAPNGDAVPVFDASEYRGTKTWLKKYENIPGVTLTEILQHPEEVTLSNVTSSGFLITYLGTDEATGGYLLFISTNKNFTSFVSGFNGFPLAVGDGVRTHLVSSLSKNTKYYVKLKSCTNDTIIKYSNDSNVAIATTKKIRSELVAAMAPWIWLKMRDTVFGTLADSSGGARNFSLVGVAANFTLDQPAVDTSELANRSVLFSGTSGTYAILEGFSKSLVTEGLMVIFDYKGSGVPVGRSICLHNTGNGSVQIFVGRTTTNKLYLQVRNSAGQTLVQVESVSDFHNNTRKMGGFVVTKNSYKLIVNGVVERSGLLMVNGVATEQSGTLLDFNRILIGGFGNGASIANRQSGNFGDIKFILKSPELLPTDAEILDAYTAGQWV